MDADRKDGTLDASMILTDWNEAERRSLLRRAIFDPATYGRVRFHHRSVQEYLAARCLKRLRDSGMATASAFALLFADQYHTKVVIPSMRPVAAWLALWDNDVRNELMKREPEALLSLGDPETLPIPARAKLLRAFADMYGQGGWRGIGISISEVRRLSCTDLTPTVRELWGKGPQNEDVRTLLLETIWCGSMAACMDIAEGVAKSAALPDRDRRIAVQALIACNQMPAIRSLADTLIAQRDFWPDRSVHDLAALIFPKVLTLDELLLLVERTHEPDKTVGGFGWELLQIADLLEPSSPLAIGLRDRLADLIWHGREPGRDFTNIAGRFDRLAPALARLCHRQIAEQPANPGDDFLRACVIAARFGGQHNHVNEPLRDLTTAVRSLIAWREPLFWADLAIMDALLPNRDDRDRLFHTCHHGLLNGLTNDDIPWIETALANKCQPERRGVAFQVWIEAWQQRHCPLDELPRLYALVSDNAELTASASRLAIPIQPNPEQERWARESERDILEAAANEAAREAEWLKWRENLIADPDSNFTAENEESTLYNMHGWLQIKTHTRNRYNAWDRQIVEKEFGEAITERVIQAGRRHWRSTRPLPQSKRPLDQWNTTPGTWIFGLSWISAEASSPGWAAQLTQEEARTAAAYAMVDINGFSHIITDLATAFPDAVDEVIGGELTAQLDLASDHRFLSVLQNLDHADRAIQNLLAHRLLTALPNMGVNASAEAAQNVSHHLHSTLRILTLVSGDSERRQVADLCAAKFEEDNSGHLALHWLRGLFALDAYRGTKLVSSVLGTIKDSVAAERATDILVALFGNRESANFNVSDHEKRAQALGKLIRIAYSSIRPEDDQQHEGSFTPNHRDNAESARQFLLGLLIQTPGPKAGAILQELAREPEFAHFPDRLRMFARQRAASDSEPPSFTPVQIVHLVRNCEMPPHDRDGLSNVMISRLNDLAHKIAVGDFTDRRTLRTISSEEEMQRTLAWRLENMAKGAYIVSREDEVADRKRVDIRLLATCGKPKAVLEIKIAYNWTLADLERALTAQLVGQYLRHEDCRAGCLLLTYNGRKNHWENLNTGRHLNFQAVLEHLCELAQKLEVEDRFGIRLSVFGPDLRDSYLEPAHR